jgi:N-acetylneuraminic acid mutarotase
MPTARIGAASGVVDGRIFVLGGSNTLVPPPAGTMATVEVFDPGTKVWSTMSDMIVPRFAGGTAIGGLGAGGPNYQNTVVAYNTSSGESSIIGLLQVARFRTGADIIGNKLYVVGGSGGSSGQALDSVEEYDLAFNTSVIKALLPVATDLPAVIAFNGKLYILGGFDANQNPLNTCLEYDPATNAIISKSPMPLARGGMKGVVSYGNRIFVLGGAVTAGPPPITGFPDIQEYNPATDTWEIAGSLPVTRGGVASQVVNNSVYIIGGSDNEQALGLTESGVFQKK